MEGFGRQILLTIYDSFHISVPNVYNLNSISKFRQKKKKKKKKKKEEEEEE